MANFAPSERYPVGTSDVNVVSRPLVATKLSGRSRISRSVLISAIPEDSVSATGVPAVTVTSAPASPTSSRTFTRTERSVSSMMSRCSSLLKPGARVTTEYNPGFRCVTS